MAALLPLLTMGLVFVSALLVINSVGSLVGASGKADKLKHKIDAATGLTRKPVSSDESALRRFKAGAWNFFGRLGSRLESKKGRAELDRRIRFIQAGFYNPNAPMIFQGVRASLTLGLPAALAGLAALAGGPLPGRVVFLVCTLLAVVGYSLPPLVLRIRTNKRKKLIGFEMPDALDLLVVCVEAGMGLDQALSRVSQELATSGPLLSEEFRILNLELRAGIKRHRALRNLSERIGIQDLDNLVTLLIQADMFGTSVAQTLRVYSDAMRTKRYQAAEEKAAKLPVKLLFPLIFCIFPSLFLIIIGPAALQLMHIFSQMK